MMKKKKEVLEKIAFLQEDHQIKMFLKNHFALIGTRRASLRFLKIYHGIKNVEYLFLLWMVQFIVICLGTYLN